MSIGMNKSFSSLALCGFFAGAFAVFLFHQVAIYILHAQGYAPVQAFSLAPTKPFGIPAVISLMFWGGIWGIIFALIVGQRFYGLSYWLISIVGASIILTATAAYIANPLKGMPAAWGGNTTLIAVALIANACWGLGDALFFRLFCKGR